MKNKLLFLWVLVGVLAASTAILGVRVVQLNEQVNSIKRSESAKGSAITNALPKVAVKPKVQEETSGETSVVVTNLPPQMAVVSVEYGGESKLDVLLSERPDMEVVRSYVSVEPMAEGLPVFDCQAKYSYSRGCYEPHLRISGEFAYRTNVTLRIRKGFPLYEKGRNPEASGSLKEDFTFTFRRKDKEPYVSFAADGRYLPPGGKRAIEIESMNVTNVWTSVRRVEPRNVVQLLAREEKEYSRYHWNSGADNEETQEIAGEPETNVFRCVNRPNAKEMTRLTVDARDGKAANGIYLVSVLNHDRPRRDYAYWEPKEENPMRFRLVCLSDLGLSVRKSGTDELGVWVTSLLRGTPVGEAWVEVYSSANVKVMEGRTDAKGWCVPKRIDRGEPFAVVVIAPDGDDMSFMALRDSMGVDETYVDGERDEYLREGAVKAFLWTDRGIYRHDEKIFLQAILRGHDRRAPKPLPVELTLTNPKGDVFSRETVLSDAAGTVGTEKFAVPAEQPSGVWTLRAKVPGKDGKVLGERKVKVEEFAPPQIRVAVKAETAAHPSNFAFTVSAEHLFGGPAHGLRCEGAVVFEDVPFAPANWKGWQFGNEELGLKPCYREVGEGTLDRDGRCRFDAPLWADAGLPKAAVRVTGQGVVFEDGGRPATMRQSAVLHYYPYYLGSTLPGWLKLEAGRRPTVDLVCVDASGKALAEPKELTAKVERIDSVYSYRKTENGWNTWDCERIRVTVAEGLKVVTGADGRAKLELPLKACGDYVVTVTDEKTRVSFGKSFYLSDWGDDVVRAPLANSTEVTLKPNKAFYRVGEAPRLTVKSPFAGYALLSVMREKEVYSEVLNLTNATSEIVLRPVTADNAPNVDVYVSVVQSVGENAKHLAVRAHGQTTVSVRPLENEIPVEVDADVVGLTNVEVSVGAPGADYMVVTVVDEAINLLTGEKTPDPVGRFAESCGAEHPLYDLYHRILPVVGEDALRANGVKTGGGFGAEMLGRVSPTPTRRFKPLALWSEKVALTDGKGWATIKLPEFVGEVRVTAVAYSAQATGAASVQKKVTPKLVMMPDAPRFVAPNDDFEITLPVYNRSGEEAKFGYEIACGGKTVAHASLVRLPTDGSTNVVARVKAMPTAGEMDILYHLRGMGEVHDQTIHLPVRPAVAWKAQGGITNLAARLPSQVSFPDNLTIAQMAQEEGWTSYRVFDSPVAELAKAMEWLADYPHGCLEQTTSRIFPLVAAGGILTAVASEKCTNRADYVAAGVKRVESMVRANGFVMWPDCNYEPWDKEVSLYAAHFLFEAEKAGQKLDPAIRQRVLGFMKKDALATNETVSAYACHTLALAGAPEKDRMLSLYDKTDKLSLLARARLARAFVAVHDRPRAEALLKNAASPSSVKEAAFAVLALLEIDPDDVRILPLVGYLNESRDRARFCWGTTEENAHALLAIGAYFRCHPPKKDDLFIAWRKLTLPNVEDVRDESRGICITRRFLSPEGQVLTNNVFRRGELLIAELTLTADASRTLSDLVIEDLFAGALEPVHAAAPAFAAGTNEVRASTWVMRSDARDDRMLVFSKKFELEKGQEAKFRYPLRVVTAGDFVLPGPSAEAMYFPSLKSKRAPTLIHVW